MKTPPYDYVQIEQHWQDEWYTNKLYLATKKNNRKFFIHFAYPGVSGYLHVGHMRGFTYCDIIARYKRMTGFDVLFPAGFHASGIPSIGFSKKVERNDPATIALLKKNGCSNSFIQTLTNPTRAVDYFSKVYVDEYWKRFGFFIDYSRLMNTISAGYKRLIQWQFQKLNEKALLVQKPHFAPFCPGCGPVAVDKSETDVSQGGSAEVLEFTILKFRLPDGTILPAATLRPETIFGVTNMWVHPNVIYEKVQINDEIWICSRECIEKLSYQLDSVNPLSEKVPGKELIGKKCDVPSLNRSVPILAGEFADPLIATGIVMSVPAHAPYDWIALAESKEKIDPITIIDVAEFKTIPAKEVSDDLNITSQKQTDLLDQATERVYKKEFHTGVLNKNCGTYAGIRVSDIKDTVKDEMIQNHHGELLREFSEEVICRCKKRVMIKKIPDQWFIKYSDHTLTQTTKEYVPSMNIYPDEYKQQLPKVLDWYDDRAVIRRGSWLGTEFPFKKGWIIEPISDSTLYPIYYLISKYVNEKKISEEELDFSFFDYILLGVGKPKKEIWKTIQEDVQYWYPVDINLGGKEHKTVHFPVYLMNHVAILKQQQWPQGIFVHWWVTQKGKEKISKSKGGAQPILEAATQYGVDAMRLYYTHVGSAFVDVEWDAEIVTKYKNRLASIWKQFHEIIHFESKQNKNLDSWLLSRLQKHIKHITEAYELFDLRNAANETFFDLPKELSWYLKRGGCNTQTLSVFLKQWANCMVPVTPHLAEQLHLLLNGKDFLSNSAFPKPNKILISDKVEVGEFLLEKSIQDTNEILKVTNITPKKICLYLAPGWKKELYTLALDLSEQESLTVGNLMKQAMTDPKLKAKAKQVSKYAAKLPNELLKLNDADRKRYRIQFDPVAYLSQAQSFLQEMFSCEVKIFSADDPKRYDPSNKSQFAVPLRPAIYIE